MLGQESIADKPFNGIVQRVILNEKTCNLSSGLSQEVTPYRGAPCGYAPCLNGGTCFPVLSRFLCHCGAQHFGPLCEHSKLLFRLFANYHGPNINSYTDTHFYLNIKNSVISYADIFTREKKQSNILHSNNVFEILNKRF